MTNAYLDAIPPARVVQLHLAGHTRHDGYLIDTHDQPVADPVWALYAHAVARLGATPTLLEWDAHLPALDEVIAEADKARRYLPAEVARAS